VVLPGGGMLMETFWNWEHWSTGSDVTPVTYVIIHRLLSIKEQNQVFAGSSFSRLFFSEGLNRGIILSL
jgi:hypothetical protein